MNDNHKCFIYGMSTGALAAAAEPGDAERTTAPCGPVCLATRCVLTIRCRSASCPSCVHSDAKRPCAGGGSSPAEVMEALWRLDSRQATVEKSVDGLVVLLDTISTRLGSMEKAVLSTPVEAAEDAEGGGGAEGGGEGAAADREAARLQP